MTASKIKPYEFKPGHPKVGGRQVGGPREKVGRAFVRAVQAEFDEFGAEAIRIARIESPVEFLKLVAKVGRIDQLDGNSGSALVRISINRFFDDKPAVTIDGVSEPMAISLPNNWRPRDYQEAVWRYLEHGGKRANLVWHRRAGKDDLAMHWTAVSAMTRPGVYWHMLPQAEQGRKAIWRAVDAHQGQTPYRSGVSARDTKADARPGNEYRARQRLESGSSSAATTTMPSSDRLRSALSFRNGRWPIPRPGRFLSPILEENDGWALFVTTPRGPNHAQKLFDYARSQPEWFAERLTADTTGVFSTEQLDKIRNDLVGLHGEKEGLSIFNQEYMCSFAAAVIGSYYGSIVEQLERDGRVCDVPYDEAVPVTTAWDLGIGDSTAIWFLQQVGKEVHAIDYYEASGADLGHYVRELQS